MKDFGIECNIGLHYGLLLLLLLGTIHLFYDDKSVSGCELRLAFLVDSLFVISFLFLSPRLQIPHLLILLFSPCKSIYCG